MLSSSDVPLLLSSWVLVKTRDARSSGFSGKIPDFVSFSGSLPASGFFLDFGLFRVASEFAHTYESFLDLGFFQRKLHQIRKLE